MNDLEGTRLPDAVLGEPGPGWDAWEGRNEKGERIVKAPAGAYMKVENDGPCIYWYIVDPEGEPGTIVTRCGAGRHAVAEHDDGTITVSPSIAPPDNRPGGWHGWLRRGIWSDA